MNHLDCGERGLRVCALAPRSSGKSELLTFAYPIYNVATGKEPFQIIGADTYKQAVQHILGIRRELRTNKALVRDYGDVFEQGEAWRQDYIEFADGTAIGAFGQDSAIRGTKGTTGKRPSVILIDDPEGKKHKISAERRLRSWEWIVKDVIPAGRPDGTTNVFMIGTAICPGCLVLRVRDEAGWVHNVFPAIEPMPTRMDLWEQWKEIVCNFAMSLEEREETALQFYDAHEEEMLAGANILWPEMYSVYDKMLNWAKDIGSFNTEDQGIPYDPEATYFDPDYLQGNDLYFDDWPPADELVGLKGSPMKLLILDPSMGETKKADYQALVAFARDRKGQEYVDCWMNREDIPNMARRCVSTALWFKPHELAVETVAFQKLLLPDIRREAEDQKAIHIKIKGLTEHVCWDKGSRIERLSSPLWQRRMKFKRNSPGVAILIQQLLEYPFGAHDDGPDALSLARLRANQMWGEV